MFAILFAIYSHRRTTVIAHRKPRWSSFLRRKEWDHPACAHVAGCAEWEWKLILAPQNFSIHEEIDPITVASEGRCAQLQAEPRGENFIPPNMSGLHVRMT